MLDTLVAVINDMQISNMMLLLIGLVLIGLMVKVMRDEGNDLEWWQFISTRSADGKNVADIDKLGKVVGIIISSWVIVKLANMGKLDAGILLVYLTFVGAVATYSAYLRSRSPNPPEQEKVQ